QEYGHEGIGHLLENEPKSRGGGTGFSPILSSENALDVVGWSLVLTNLHERAHYRPDHPVKKSIGDDLEPPVTVVRLGNPAGILHGAFSVLRFGLRNAERVEIVVADQISGSDVHPVEIGCRPYAPAHMPVQRTKSGGDVVMVAARDGIIARVKSIADGFDGANGDRFGQDAVQRGQ